MKKIISLLLIILVTSQSAQAWWIFGSKKNDGVVEQGYSGELPKIEKFFEYKQTETKGAPRGDILNAPVRRDNLLEAPEEDLFLDIIIKQDKHSQYVNDIHKLLPILEKFKEAVEAGANIQKFNANVNVLDLHVRNLSDIYGERYEANTPSYQAVMEINYRAKLLGNLRFDANFYSKYLPLTDEAYSPAGIAKQDAILVQELERVIRLIKEAK